MAVRRLAAVAAIALAFTIVAPVAMTGGPMASAEESLIETPPYEVVETLGVIEIRQYGERLAAETDMDGAMRGMGQYRAFMALADFIFANSRQGESVAMTAPVEMAPSSEPIAMTAPVAIEAADPDEPIDMTAPVEQAPAGERNVMRFFMPGKYTMETLPKPGDERVRIVMVPAQTLAVLRFRGEASEEIVAGQTARLLAGLEGSGWKPVAQPGYFGYSGPDVPVAERRNEVVVEVAPAE
jgi:hypothetical protein